MLRLAIWQFRYSWKSWIGSLILFGAAGFVIGFTMIGVGSSISAKVNYGNYNPVVLFTTPVIFGLITLILIISGITRLLINKFKSDYKLWSILGADSTQLAVLIGVQMGLMGMVGGFFGYFLAYPVVKKFYYWVRTNPGMTKFPMIDMKMQLSSLIITMIVLGLMIGILGLISARKIFSNIRHGHVLIKRVLLVLTWIWITAVYSGTIYVYSLFFKEPRSLMELFRSPTLENTYLQLLLVLIILMIMTINNSERIILPILVKSLSSWYPVKMIKTFQTAYWNVLEKREFLRNVTFPIFIFSLISSFFMYLAFDLANISTKRSLSEIFGTLTLFLGAPFLIILANVISLTMISSAERSSNANLLNILGFTVKDLLFEKGIEASIYSVIVFIQGTIGNAILYIPILQASYYTHTQMKDGWFSITWIPMSAGIIVFVFIWFVDGFYIFKKIGMNNRKFTT